MATFVIVHGAWGGGWEWSPVADLLRRDGHRAFTPTLTGMGEWAEQAGGDPVAAGAARAPDAGWVYREISVGHDPQVFDAEGIARLLTGLAS